MVLWIDAYGWVAMRFILGFCFSGLFMAIESWLNEATANQDRARVLSIYRVVDLAVVTGSQFLLPLFGVGSFAVFAVAAIMITLSLVPVSLGDRSSPKPPEQVAFDLRTLWRISPLASLGCITIGLTNSAFRTIGPLFADDAGLSTADIAVFMSAGIIGGAVLQYPLGWMSDRLDRRYVFIAATLGAAAAGLFLSRVAGTDKMLLYAGIFVFGAFSLPLYSLSAAHANDRAQPGQYVLVAAGLSFFYSIGAAAGPFAVAWVMKIYGTSAFFTYTSVIHLILIGITLWRMRARSRPETRRGGFTAVLRTSPVFARMARSATKRD
jgi:MFS family permease